MRGLVQVPGQYGPAGGEFLDPQGQIVDGVAVAGQGGRAVVHVVPAVGQAFEEGAGALDRNAQAVQLPGFVHQPGIVLGVVPVTVGEPGRGDQPQRLVVANRLRRHTRAPRDLTDPHDATTVNPSPGGKVKPSPGRGNPAPSQRSPRALLPFAAGTTRVRGGVRSGIRKITELPKDSAP